MAEDPVVADAVSTAPAPVSPREDGPSASGNAVIGGGRGVRARLARIGTSKQTGNPELEPLFRAVKANHPKADLSLLERAYATAEFHHRGQMRKSGDPYITHPL